MFKKKEDEQEVKNQKNKEKTKTTQRSVVFNRIKELVKEQGLKIQENQPVMDVLTSESLKTIYDRVCNDFKSGKAPLKKTQGNKEKLEDEKKLRVYVVGLCSNWLRRDPKLNGDEKFPA